MKYKTLEELKDELGDSFEEYMYKANIELLEQKRKAIEYIKNIDEDEFINTEHYVEILNFLEVDKQYE